MVVSGLPYCGLLVALLVGLILATLLLFPALSGALLLLTGLLIWPAALLLAALAGLLCLLAGIFLAWL